MTRRIDVHIDELVLDGVPASDATVLTVQVQDELRSLLAQRGLAPRAASADRVARDLTGAPTGAGIARAVYDGISRCTP